jgi:hypothetical protein
MWSGRRIVLVVALGVLVIVGLAGWWRHDYYRGQGVHRVPWHLTSPPGTVTLAVATAGGSCGRWKGWTIRESESTVVIEARMWLPRHGTACPADAQTWSITVGLHQSLGTRRLLGCHPPNDASDCTGVDPDPYLEDRPQA